jgi:hypothetical protein
LCARWLRRCGWRAPPAARAVRACFVGTLYIHGNPRGHFMEFLDLNDDVLAVVAEHVGCARRERLVVPLPSKDGAIRRLPCVNYDDKLYVLYIPGKTNDGTAESAAAVLRAARDGAPGAVIDIDLAPWINVFADHRASLYALKISVGITGSVRMRGHVALLALPLVPLQPVRATPPCASRCVWGAVETEGRLAPPGAEFRLNDRTFMRERTALGRLVWVPVDG